MLILLPLFPAGCASGGGVGGTGGMLGSKGGGVGGTGTMLGSNEGGGGGIGGTGTILGSNGGGIGGTGRAPIDFIGVPEAIGVPSSDPVPQVVQTPQAPQRLDLVPQQQPQVPESQVVNQPARTRLAVNNPVLTVPDTGAAENVDTEVGAGVPAISVDTVEIEIDSNIGAGAPPEPEAAPALVVPDSDVPDDMMQTPPGMILCPDMIRFVPDCAVPNVVP